MLTLHNLSTGESRIISHPVITSSDELLITSEESLTCLLDLQSAWLKDFPGQSHGIITWRNDVIRTDWLRRRARTVLQQFQLELYFTGLPAQYWDRLIQQQIRFLEKQADRAQNEFRKAFQLLQSLKPAPGKPEEPPAPPQPARDFSPTWMQNIKIKIIDGKTVTTFEPKNEKFLDPEILSFFGRACRNYYFCDGIPDEYTWILHDDGVDYDPSKTILVYYSMEEFEDICHRELAAQSEHLLDGARIGYRHIG